MKSAGPKRQPQPVKLSMEPVHRERYLRNSRGGGCLLREANAGDKRNTCCAEELDEIHWVRLLLSLPSATAKQLTPSYIGNKRDLNQPNKRYRHSTFELVLPGGSYPLKRPSQ